MTAEGPVAAESTPRALVDVLETYLQDAALVIARAEQVGPFTLFCPEGPGPYFARPRPEAGPATDDDLRHLVDRFDDLGSAVDLGWLASGSPELEDRCRRVRLRTSVHPLLTAGTGDPRWGEDAGPDEAHELVVLRPGSPLLPAALASVAVAFGTPPGQGLDETGGLDQGVADRRLLESTYPPARLRLLSERIESGQAVITVALVEGEVVGMGHYRPVGGVAEVVGLATLPAFRRRGLASALTCAQVRHAARHGVDLLFLTARSSDVGSLHLRLGFAHSDRFGQAVG